MATAPSASPLDLAVREARDALRERGVPAPEALLLLATGVAGLADLLEDAEEVELGELTSVPEPWREVVLVAGRLGGTRTWALDDVGLEPGVADGRAPWAAAFPVWLAADAGASLCLHASAGTALTERTPVGGFAVVRDHLNLSGSSPLVGLGESRLGPLFPDQSRLHHVGLRRAALARGEALGIPAVEAVCACVAGPTLETPAERRFWASVGAEVAVQGLAAPLHAAAHAGLACLAIVSVLDDGGTPDVAQLVARAVATQPALEELLGALVPDVAGAARALSEEAGR